MDGDAIGVNSEVRVRDADRERNSGFQFDPGTLGGIRCYNSPQAFIFDSLI